MGVDEADLQPLTESVRLLQDGSEPSSTKKETNNISMSLCSFRDNASGKLEILRRSLAQQSKIDVSVYVALQLPGQLMHARILTPTSLRRLSGGRVVWPTSRGDAVG